MKFTVVISVLTATCSQVFGYPLATEMHDRISNEISQANNEFGRFEFILPTAVKGDYEIQAKGILNTDHDSLTVLLPENEHKEHCRITHNFKQNKIRVSPAPTDTDESKGYDIVTETDVKEFSITLNAKSVNNSEMFEVKYQIVGNGEIADLRCYAHFDDLKKIVFKEGVLVLRSLKFTFL